MKVSLEVKDKPTITGEMQAILKGVMMGLWQIPFPPPIKHRFVMATCAYCKRKHWVRVEG